MSAHTVSIERQAPGSLDLVRWVALPSHADSRGVLTAVESGRDIPFEVERVYLLHGLRADRGGHAHRDSHQLVIAAAGSFELALSDGVETRSYRLEDPTRGLYFGPMLFIRLRGFSPDAAVVVLASTHYDKKRSIYSWEEYREAIGG